MSVNVSLTFNYQILNINQPQSTPSHSTHPMSMLSVSEIKKAVTLAHLLFQDHFTGRNAGRGQLPNELKFSVLIVASRFLEVAEQLAKNSCALWSEAAVSTISNLNGEIMAKYAESWELWRQEKKKAYACCEIPRSKLSDRIGYRVILDEEMQLTRSIRNYTNLQKGYSMKDRGIHMGNLVLQIATLAAGIVGVVDADLGDSVQQRLTHAVVDYPGQTAVQLANNEQKSEVMKWLNSSKRFESAVILKMSMQNLYVITHGCEMQVCGYVFVNLPVHLPSLKQKDALITFIEVLPGFRLYSLASKLLEGIKLTAKNNGYRSMYTESLAPDPVFWVKCGFTPYANKRNKRAICCLDKMSFMNILN